MCLGINSPVIRNVRGVFQRGPILEGAIVWGMSCGAQLPLGMGWVFVPSWAVTQYPTAQYIAVLLFQIVAQGRCLKHGIT